jgi:D-serine deaminase-like pyridoxal phosphate-dependent protein
MAGELTPYARVDLDAVDRNIARLQGYCDRHGLAFRPHIKTHRTAAIAHRQLRAGAVGVTCQKLGEAEAMVQAGVGDVLVAYPIVGAANLARLVALAREARVGVALDSDVVATGISDIASEGGVEIEALVELDAGLGRTGVRTSEAAVALAGRVDVLPGLRLGGLMTYPTPPDTALLRATAAAWTHAGLPLACISVGGTRHALRTHELELATELRAGTYVLGDRACVADGSVALGDCALHVRATVVSTPEPWVAILDAGSKALTSDPVEVEDISGHGTLVGRPGARVTVLFEEHARVELDVSEPPLGVGDTVDVVPNHACGAMNLHDEIVVHRSGMPIGSWSVTARGASR